ncbi:MAG: hypothetical protein GX552_01785 [Chloroflexi bacterium]|nr:hypothetical protein [Chloroflexota bacterium]
MRQRITFILLLGLLLLFATAQTLPAASMSDTASQTAPVPSFQRASNQIAIEQPGAQSHDPHQAAADEAAKPSPLASALPDLYKQCSRIVYQKWINDNWELFMAHGDGSTPVRLTDNVVADESPSIATSCELIVWASEQSGNQDIYAMRRDGSDLRRMTTHPARDVLPALSPDGRFIAYQSYQDHANPEIYVVSTEGGAPVRLTHNTVYDGQPSWSPDGRTLAFVSARSGTYNLWLMGIDGGHPRQITNLPYVGGPRWSPDGTQIAFACDMDGDGFTSLWVVDRNGIQPRLIWQPDQANTDVWPGAWSFNGRYVIYEQARWAYSDGWHVTQASIHAIAPTQPQDRRPLVEGGINLAPSWAYCDLLPPSSEVAPLPVISTSPVNVTWSGSDSCSPVLSYHAQYRLGGTSNWVDWQLVPGQTWTRATGGLFAWTQPGTVVYFRVRASDETGNVEDWPASAGDARTSFPARVSGSVRDCRGVPIAGARVSGPTPFGTSDTTDIAGQYALLAASERPDSLTASAEGFRSSRLSRPSFDDGQGTDFYLRAEPELVVNGGFELGQAAWYTSGTARAESSTFGYDSQIMRLGGLPGATSTASPADLSAPTAAPPTLQQSLTIPADLAAPTLSFLYALENDTGPLAGTLTAAVQDETGETILWQGSQPTPWRQSHQGGRYPLWQQAHADLTPWAGQTVTLVLRYDPQGTYSYALLDEVSVSPWILPHVQAVDPATVPPGVGQHVGVRGANFYEGAQVRLGAQKLQTTYHSDTLLSAYVPPSIRVGRYDVWVRNPTGYESTLPGGLTIGYAVQLPLVQRQ